MRPARILLLVIAILAGGLAAYLATRGGAPAPVSQPAVAEAKASPAAQILVAKTAIGVGQRLSPATVEWQAWPQDAVRPEYITIALTPDAPGKITGAVARYEFFPGEPIREEKLVRSNQGYLSAVLAQGMRGVSVQVTAASGSGGFIIPNDRVDVVVTDASQGATSSRTILNDVKVLAIGTRLGQTGTTGAPVDANDPKSQIFINDAIATLELDPGQAEKLINATALGKISLVLRSVADFGKTETATAAPGDNQTVNVIRFGKLHSITSGSSDQGGPAVNSAVYVPPALLAPTVTVTTGPAAIAAPAAAASSTTTAAPSIPAATVLQ